MGMVKLGISIGVLAGIWVWLSGVLGVATWPTFIGWALFFAAGGDHKATYKAALPLITGTLLGWVAVMTAPYLGGIAVTVGIVAVIMTVMGLIPGFELVPAQFASCAAFFGMGATTAAITGNLIPILIGVAFGWLSAMLPKLVPDKEAEKQKAA
jgi:hypothetical protein